MASNVCNVDSDSVNVKNKRIVSKRCVAYGCSNTSRDGFSLFLFPKNPEYRALWNTEVKKLRQDFIEPSAYSCLCSEHFSKDMFEPSCLMKKQMGVDAIKMRLLPTAILKISKPDSKRKESCVVRPAAAKRQRKQVSVHIILIIILHE